MKRFEKPETAINFFFTDLSTLFSIFDPDDLYLVKTGSWSHGPSYSIKFDLHDNRYKDPTVYRFTKGPRSETIELLSELGLQTRE